jgi:hypothetical protein
LYFENGRGQESGDADADDEDEDPTRAWELMMEVFHRDDSDSDSDG